MQQHKCGFKILTRWYRTPAFLYKFSNTFPNRCWCCDTSDRSMLHIWWSCPKMQPFWNSVHDTILEVTSENIEISPAQYLLHHTTIPKKRYLKSLVMLMINAAKHCIPCHWRTAIIPTKKEQFHKLNNMEKIEELISISQENICKFTRTWYSWQHFKTTSA